MLYEYCVFYSVLPVCMYCTYVCTVKRHNTYIRMYVYEVKYVRTYVYTLNQYCEYCIHRYVRIYSVCTYSTFVTVRTCICIYTYVRTYVCISTCFYTCTYVHVSIRTYVRIKFVLFN